MSNPPGKSRKVDIEDVEQENLRVSRTDGKRKLTDEEVCEIRRLFYLKGVTNGTEIARMYGIDKRVCWAIIKGELRMKRTDDEREFGEWNA